MTHGVYVPNLDFTEEILPDGTRAKRWKNGSLTHYDTGQIIEPAVKIVTREDGQAMVAKRHAKRQAVIAEHITIAVGAKFPDEALGKIAAARTKVAMEDPGRAGNDAAKLVFQILDAMPEKTKGEQVIHKHELSEKSIELLTRLAQARNDPDFEYLEGSISVSGT